MKTLFFFNISHSPYIASHANVLRGSSRLGQERVTNPQERLRRGLRTTTTTTIYKASPYRGSKNHSLRIVTFEDRAPTPT